MHVSRPDHDRPRLTLFGGPFLERSPGAPVLLTPSHERLLTLAWGHEERGLSRASAIWLLWEEEDAPRLRQRLRQLLHDLTNRLGFRPLVGHGEGRLQAGSALVSSDLDDYHRALGAHELRTAMSLFTLGFGARLDGRAGGEEYEDWLLSKREGLRRQLAEAAARGWDRARPTGAWPAALQAAEVLAALDPESEAAMMKLVEARAVTGSIQGAEQAATSYLARLPRGSAASREATALFERIRRMRPPTSISPPVKHPQPPLVGRREALQLAREVLDRVASGSFEFLLLRGEGGVGKTRLMEEVRKEALVSGFRCLQARPVELERRIPLNPLVDMLGEPSVAPRIRTLDEPWRSVIASLLPTLPAGMDPPVVPPIAETSLSRRLYDAFATLFTEMADVGPHLLFLDDLQWADATTIAVLQFVQRRWRSGPLGVIAAVRPELVNKSDEIAKYLTDTPDLPVTTLELGELTDAEARALLNLVAETELASPAANRLLALGGRNPFYLIELTRDYVAGKVQLPELPTEAITLPISLRQLLEPRIRELDEGAATIASHLAVWGRGIPLTDLARLTEVSLTEAAAHVEGLERARLATVESGQVSLGHELFRSTIYQSLSATRRALLHGRVAAFLDHGPVQQPGEIAIHFARAGDAAGAAFRGREAANRAMESGAMAEAAYFLQLVVDNARDALVKAEATADLARVLHMSREITRANPVLELAASRLRAVGRHDKALRMDIRRVEGLAELGAAPLSDLLDRLASIKALAREAHDDEALALALDSELHLLHRSGKVAEIRALFDEIRPLAVSPDRAAASLANAALALNVLFGDPDEALRCAREAVRIAEEGEGGTHRLLAYSRLSLVLIYRGLLSSREGLATLARAKQVAENSGDLTLRAYVELNQGVFAMEIANFSLAADHFENTAKILAKSMPGLPHVTLYYNLGEMLIQEGRYIEAREALQRGVAASSPTTPLHLTTLIRAGTGLCALQIGDLTTAREAEGEIGPPPPHLYYDPTTILEFRAALLPRRGQGTLVLEEVEAVARNAHLRLPLVWLKLTLLAGRLRSRLRLPPPPWLDEAILLGESLPGYGRIDALRQLRDLPKRAGKTGRR